MSIFLSDNSNVHVRCKPANRLVPNDDSRSSWSRSRLIRAWHELLGTKTWVEKTFLVGDNRLLVATGDITTHSFPLGQGQNKKHLLNGEMTFNQRDCRGLTKAGIEGNSYSTVVERTPLDQEVMDSDPAGPWTFLFLLPLPSVNFNPRGCAALFP